MPLHHSSSIIESAEYQDDQEDTGVTGFMTVSIDLKNVEAKTDSQSELKKSLELLPSSKESKKVCTSRNAIHVCKHWAIKNSTLIYI